MLRLILNVLLIELFTFKSRKHSKEYMLCGNMTGSQIEIGF